MTDETPLSPPPGREDAARFWLVRLNAGDAADADYLAFAGWMEDADNAAAFRRAEDDWIALDDAREAVLAKYGAAPAAESWRDRLAAVWTGGGRWGLAAAGLAAALLIGVVALNTAPPAADQFATAIGETRTVVLNDGSTVSLNTGSEIRVAIGDGGARRVDLVAGQALFDVVRDPSRPFHVRSGAADVHVVGTRFDILRTQRALTVTVVEGTVRITPASGEAGDFTADVLVGADHQFRLVPGTAPSVVRVESAEATAWRQGQLIFKDTALAEIAETLGRYFPQRFAVDDSAAGLRFTGVLHVDDLDRLLASLAGMMPVTYRRSPDGVVLSRDTAAREPQ